MLGRLSWTQFFVIFLLVNAPILAWQAISPWAGGEVLLLAGGTYFILLRLRGDRTLLGPHFYYDLIRLARRGRSTLVRIAYVIVLFAGLAFIYSEYFGRRGQLLEMLFEPGVAVSINSMARLAERFVLTIIVVQNIAILLMTPAYIATALTEERERRTLELLFSTHLTDREIVLGKLMARLVHMGGVLLAGLPILSLAQFFGGVDMIVLLGNFAITAMNLWTIGAICIMTSAMSRSATAALLTSYGTLIPIAYCFGCFSVIITQSDMGFVSQQNLAGDYRHLLEILGALLVLHGIISFACIAVALHNVRSYVDSDLDSTPGMIRELQEYQWVATSRRDSKELEPEERIVMGLGRRGVRQVEGEPLLWKEMNTGDPVLAAILWLPIASLLFPLVMVFFAALLDQWGPENKNVLHGLATTMVICVAGLFCLGGAFRACVSVVRERQQGTLDALLTTPVDRRDILKAKWLGAMYKGWIYGAFLLAIMFLGVVGGGIHPIGAALLTLAVLVDAAFLISLGLYASVTSATALAAQTKIAIFLIAVLGNWTNFQSFVNPPMCWYRLCSSPAQLEHLPADMRMHSFAEMALNPIIFGVGALVLWRLACRGFRE